MNYNYFRDYEPDTGRYVESDPIGITAEPNTYAYVKNSPLSKWDIRGLEDSSGIVPEKACKLIEKGYNPDNDGCGCQKGVMNDLCDCYHKYSSFWQIGQQAECVEKAYLKKSKCAGNCTACNSTGGGGNYAP